MSARTQTLKEIAYDTIRKSIVTGEWEGGTFLSEKWLSERLQMSKTPIRSALDRLEMMGLVKLIVNQGAVIQEISLRKIMEIYELRLSLESHAAKQLTGKLSADVIQQLTDILSLQAAAVEHENLIGYVELDRRFHEQIIAALDNEEILEVMTRLQDKFSMALRTTFIKNKSRLWGSLDEHRQILTALAGNNPESTVQLITEHIQFEKNHDLKVEHLDLASSTCIQVRHIVYPIAP